MGKRCVLSPLSCSPTRTRPQAPEPHHVRAGWERGRVKECVLEMRAGRPVIIYRITYHDGEEVPAAFTATQHGPRALSHTTHAPPPRGAQVAEDLRTLSARRVREVAAEEDVQCVQQCWSMLKVGWCKASPHRAEVL